MKIIQMKQKRGRHGARGGLVSTLANLGHKLARPITGLAASALVLAMVAVLGGASQANAWGPNRATFTMAQPSTYVTFNSITDDPSWGDERGFTVIKDVTGQENNGTVAAADGFSETAEAQDGHTYMVKMFVHNNAAANYNLVAKNTRVGAYLPTSSDTSAQIQGIISADNCGANKDGATGSACSFWDEAYIKGADNYNFRVSMVGGSVRYYNNIKDFKTEGFTLGDSILASEGAKLGYEQMDGNMQGCFQYSGYVTFLVQVETDQPSFTLTKRARVKGQDNWGYNITAKAGDTIQYQVNLNNVGKTKQTAAVVRDYMTQGGLVYQAGSTYLINGKNPRPGAHQTDDSWINKGLKIGDYEANSNGLVEYEAKVPEEKDLQCGDNVFDNVVFGSTAEAGTKLASNKVTVHKDCATPPATTDVCEYDKNLPKDDPKCVKPGVPAAGNGVATALTSLSLFLIISTIAIALIAHEKKHSYRK